VDIGSDPNPGPRLRIRAKTTYCIYALATIRSMPAAGVFRMYKGERFNSISHLIGAAAALAGTAGLVVTAAQLGDPWKIVSFSIYGVSLILLYLFSTLYHSLHYAGKTVFKKLDHLAIYLLIAGTYTPFTLVTLRGRGGWVIFGLIWGLAVLGIVLEVLVRKGLPIVSVVIYLAMGWLIIIALKPLLASLTTAGFIWLLMGGLFYSSGVVFYALGSATNHFHGIWHLFVMAGSLCHFITIFYYVA
jgi:hemolysin III